MSPLLNVRGVEVDYGRVSAVRNVDFQVQPGALVTIIGANGAGKTTLLNALAGLIPLQGDVVFNGISLSGHDTEDRVAMGLSLVPEQRALFGSMSVADNLLLGGNASRAPVRVQKDLLIDVYERFPVLAERRKQLASTLSGGERQMLALGRALMGRPKLLMLDEPSLGLAPLLVRKVFAIIRDLRETGVSILLVEQNARAALETADYGYVMETGEVVLHGPSGELMTDARVMDSYLGRT